MTSQAHAILIEERPSPHPAGIAQGYACAPTARIH
jgi:hypothetical protein